MTLILKKNIMPAFKDDVQAGIEFMGRVRGLGIDFGRYALGFEAIIRYKDMANLPACEKNLRPCIEHGYPLSLHAPLNHPNPSTVDIALPEGFQILERLVELSDRVGIPLIVAHPNALRTRESFEAYTRQQQQDTLGRIVENVRRLNQLSPNVQVAVENKYSPTKDALGEGGLYSPAATLFSHLQFLRDSKIPLVFDTAHYAINRAVVNSLLVSAAEGKTRLADSFLGNHGFFPESLSLQPTVSEALAQLGDAVQEIHYNDAALYKPYDGSFIFFEGLVPGRGCLVNHQDVRSFLEKTPVPVLFEVYEKDYKLSPNARASIEDFLMPADSRSRTRTSR